MLLIGFILLIIHQPLQQKQILSYYQFGLSLFLLLLFLNGYALIYLNRKSRKTQSLIKFEQERYKKMFQLTSGVLWEFSVQNETLSKSHAELGIYTGTVCTPNYRNYILDHQIIYEEDLPVFEEFYACLLSGKDRFCYELRAKNCRGEYVWYELSAASILDDHGNPFLVLGQTTNIDDRKKEMEALRSMQELDSLTRLLNRNSIFNEVNNVLFHSEERQQHAFLLVDLDQFKAINDEYGFVFGDALLLELALKLSKAYQDTNTLISRFGADEFILFLQDIPSLEFALTEAQHILELIPTTFLKEDAKHMITACIGISIAPRHGAHFDYLLANADTALYYAKDMGPNKFCLFDSNFMSPANCISLNGDSFTKNFLSHKGQSIIDSSIISNAVDILFDAKDIKTSITMILSVIGNFYDLYNIAIYQMNEDDLGKGYRLYSWNMETSECDDETTLIPRDDFIAISKYNQHNNNLFHSTNLQHIQSFNPFVARMLQNYEVDGFLECGLRQKGDTIGYISYTFKNPGREWEQHEIDSLSLITKVLGGYLNAMHNEDKARRIQHTDTLTQANNLPAFVEKATRLVHENPNTNYVIFYSNIDKFKLLNDTCGYSEGNRILIEFSNCLKAMISPKECFGRISSDRFVGLFEFDTPILFFQKMKALNDHMNQLPKNESDAHRIPIIIGLNPITMDLDMSLNIDRAIIAEKSILNRHKSRYVFFHESMQSRMIKQREIEDLMEDALRKEEFTIYYQPKVYLDTNAICGVEALVRWDHPGKGIIPPNEFIPIFEENHFIIKLDYYVFEEACKHIRKLLDLGKQVYPVSINISRFHLHNNEILGVLSTIVAKYEIPIHYLELELTEGAFQEDDQYMYYLVNELQTMGFRISMDDFGSGLSSLNYLRNLPFNVLKLDKDFLQKETSTKRERIVIEHIVKLAHDLDMTIVAEGVETEDQAEFLRSIHCDMAQGYLFSKAIPRTEYEKVYYGIS